VSREVVRRTSGGFAIPVEAILAAGGELDAPPALSGGVAAPASGAVTAPMSVHDVPTRPVSALDAGTASEPVVTPDLSATLRGVAPAARRTLRATAPPPPPAAAMDVVDADIVEESSPELPPRGPAPSSAPSVGEESGTHELPPGLEPPVVSETAGSFDPTESMPWPVRHTEELARDDEWDAPPALPVREPTLIINPDGPGGPDGANRPGPPFGAVEVPVPVDARASAALDVTERNQGGAWAVAASMPPVIDEDEAGVAASAARPAPAPRARAAVDHVPVDDGLAPPIDDAPDVDAVDAADAEDAPADDLDDVDLDADLSELSISRPVPAALAAANDGAAATPPTGGDFARQLRAKMSLMAERLFRQGSSGDLPAASALDVRPPHDFRTEIDFAALDAAAQAGGTEVYDVGGVTFAGDERHVGTSPGGAEAAGTDAAARSTSEAGELQRGERDAAALIARMFASELTGHIVFRRDERGGTVEKIIYFDSGRPVFASSTLPADRMGELLFREGKITAEQYAGCRDLVSESGRRMGEILVDKGFLKRRELLPAVRRHVEDIIYSLFAWDTGEYRIVPGDGAATERIRLSRHPAAMVLEGVRRKLDLATLERLLGPPGTVVEVADRDKAGTMISVADLSADERTALAAMDGSADLGQIARATGASLAAVYQLAWSLGLLGVATVRRRGGDDDEAHALVGETDLAIDRERVRARHRLVDEADYFALLGVRRDATAFEIRRAYEAARRDFDPDAFPPELRAELARELAEIGAVLDEGFRVLADDALRGSYLANLAD
jgi:hypothetical protein